MRLSSATIDHEGIGAGRLDALEALIAARGDSVIAYTLELAGEEMAGRAAAEAMARFRGAITALGADSREQMDVLLLAATRHAGAASANLDRIWQSARIQERDRHCELMPTMLAARAVGHLNGADLERVARHLWRCEGCRLVEAAFARAEQAYREPAVDPEPHEVEMMIAALQRAAPIQSVAPTNDEAVTTIPRPEQSTPVVAAFDLDAADHKAHLLAEAAQAYAALTQSPPEPHVPGRSATLAFGMLTMVAVAVVLAVSYLLDGLPG